MQRSFKVKLPAKLGACGFCIRTAVAGLAASIGAYLLAVMLLDILVVTVSALAAVAAFGLLSLAHAVAYVMRRFGWAYSVAPCCSELAERAQRYQDLRSRRAMLGKVVAATGSVLLLNLFTGVIGGRGAAQAHDDGDTETEILTGREAEAVRARMHDLDSYQDGRETLTRLGYRPKTDEEFAIITRTSHVDGRVWTQLTLPFISQTTMADTPQMASLAAVEDASGNLLVLGLTFDDGPEVAYRYDNFGSGSEISTSEIETQLNDGLLWHRHCIGPVCVNYCIIVCGAIAGACGVGCAAACTSVCPPCAPFCAGICAGACAGVCIPTCENINH